MKALERRSIVAYLAVVVVSAGAVEPTKAYENDVHFAVTFSLARAVGWTSEEARIIASATQGVDENKETLAGLVLSGDLTSADTLVPTQPSFLVPSPPSLLVHQATNNFRYHGFARSDDAAGKVDLDLLHAAPRTADLSGNSQSKEQTLMLISIGVRLHYYQDAFSHNAYGGTCGSQPGKCVGHADVSAWDRAEFYVTHRHSMNPDHPALEMKNREMLLQALQWTVVILSENLQLYGERFFSGKRSPSTVPAAFLDELVDDLRRPDSLALPDEDRQMCNSKWAAQWLYSLLNSTHRLPSSKEATNLTGSASNGCAVDASKPSVEIPAPEYPRLSTTATPIVAPNGTYQHVGNPDAFDLEILSFSATQRKDGVFSFDITVTNARSVVSVPARLQLIVIGANLVSFGQQFSIGQLQGNQSVEKKGSLSAVSGDYAVIATLEPEDVTGTWNDANVANDQGLCQAVPQAQVAVGDIATPEINPVVSSCDMPARASPRGDAPGAATNVRVIR